jgi:hypothetical protein
MRVAQTVSVKANLACEVKSQSDGRNHNRLHVQKALIEYLLLGKVKD